MGVKVISFVLFSTTVSFNSSLICLDVKLEHRSHTFLLASSIVGWLFLSGTGMPAYKLSMISSMLRNSGFIIRLSKVLLSLLSSIIFPIAVSYTHLTLPTNREV